MTEPADHAANRALVQRAADTHNARDRDAFLACYANPMTYVSGDHRASVTGDQHWRAVLSWASTFDGFTEEIQQMVTEGNLVFLRSLYRGVHRGEWRGVAPTGRHVQWEAWQVLTIEGGLIVEERMIMDEWSLHEQLTAAS
jgi:predicted ester cyclase